ncbi:MAG: FAD:protein FMN transferase [Candidatus Riflebacteria bacterium]|nr:FAD:protein FMN transferase [Candidatus Riflebacteria bacterium]
MSKIVRIIFILILVFFIYFRETKKHELFEKTERSEKLMDTIVYIQVYGDPEIASRALDAAFKRMRSVEEIASFHLPKSELNLLNVNREIVPSASFSEILELSSKSVKLTEGRFDPTFAVFHKAYGFYGGTPRLPNEAEITELKRFIGWNRVISQEGNKVRIASGALLDLSGIAGGFAEAAAAEELRKASVKGFIIDDGGDLYMEGEKGDGSPWKVGVRDPRNESFMAVVETFSPNAISTSGDYERYVEIDGKRYHHIFDVSTGRPAPWYKSVTVIASDPRDAEIQTKWVFTLPPEEAKKLCNEKNLPVLVFPATGAIWVSEEGKNFFQQ